jgi:saccharopine dehydrogenase (NAD+, L-lysine-forming)
MEKNILILGGYGKTGSLIAELLLMKLPDLQITLAGRNLDKAQKKAHYLNNKLTTQNVFALQVDASDQSGLTNAFKQTDFIVNASSTIDQTAILVKAVIESGKDYLDTHLSSPSKLEILYQNDSYFMEKDICYVTDGGFHPGLPASLIRFCSLHLDEITEGNVYGALKIKWADIGASKETMAEFIDEFKNYSTLVYKNREWKKQSFFKTFLFDFGEPFGPEKCVPMFLEEFKVLVKQLPNLRETGFYIAGFNPFLDNWLMPIIFMGISVVPKKWAGPFVNLFLWGSKFTKPPYGVKLVGKCLGFKDSKPINLRIEIANSDEYLLTATPVVACLLQLLDGSIRKPGLWFQSNLAEPMRFMKSIQEMGVEWEFFRNSEKVG